MVKKIVALLMLFLAVGGTNLYANIQGNPLALGVRDIDDTPIQSGYPRTPILIPTVWQEDHVLEIDAPHAEYVLNIVSGTTVVYSVVVPETVSLVVLPATLSGTYELQLIQGNLCFYGDIDL